MVHLSPKQSKNNLGQNGQLLSEGFRKMLLCFHEAGHAVVGHSLGWHLLKMTTSCGHGQAHFAPVVVPNMLLAFNSTERARRIDATRAAMTVVTAGHVAATIHQLEVEARGFSSRGEAKTYSKFWEIRIGVRFPIIPDHNPYSDYAYAVRDGRNIALAEAIAKGQQQVELKDHTVEAQKEILTAEAAAEKILRHSWTAVNDIAMALHKAKAGELGRRQLLARFNKHGVIAQTL